MKIGGKREKKEEVIEGAKVMQIGSFISKNVILQDDG